MVFVKFCSYKCIKVLLYSSSYPFLEYSQWSMNYECAVSRQNLGHSYCTVVVVQYVSELV